MKPYECGDRVIMTDCAIEQGLNSGNLKYPPTIYGTVVSAQVGTSIGVVRDERKNSNRYHVDFWRPV